MKVRLTKLIEEDSPLHVFAYGYPGCGKSKLGRDFHEAGQSIVLVTGENTDFTFGIKGIQVPIITPANEHEFRAIIEAPHLVTEKVIRAVPGLENYEPKTWVFDNIRTMQQILFGEGGRKAEPVFDGAFTIDARKPTGIMALPNARDSAEVPSNKDYRVLDARMRALVFYISHMSCNTIVTAHAEQDYDIKTRKALTGDAKADKDVDRTITGYPSLDGFQLKYDLPGLISDFYLYLEWTGTQFIMYPRHAKGFMARTKVDEVMSPSIDWTGKNGYEILRARIKVASGKK